jgi:hypothetical protein
MPQDYAPYNTMPAFQHSIADYNQARLDNPYRGVDAQAWDRGTELAMRMARYNNS